MDQPSRLQNDPDRERDFPVLASDVAKASPYVRADALQEDLSGGQVMRRRRSESGESA